MPHKEGQVPSIVLVNRWLDIYHYYWPHEALDYMTPAEFSAKMGISIPRIGKLS
jgi:transposase InsO family protein